ncbi:metallophosphoesterase [Komagataeibacter rhaeticus]|uniref:metallophosphoesterase n=1 Tax=Komagataeibacter rhaeticus TaxID=215221 RepID=UPI0004D8B4DC|nr:metallophosphoesterase [Komagataeibacter rhaeticus]KDU94538.1 metallophosphoesterase [Komagataeibacter rhaeticus AF1]MBL7238676.1 metallophosphoesterase [Komagataeibacter rhaeticus]PYD53697.1 metallophosphoesterase [Komagataeibacter rhaeticus]GBQ11255.1 putative phosphoesterase [Komagataeibacter rhaeticus DSM 16663]
MTTWFTADLHFGHESIIRHCHRPFVGVAEMDAVLAANWNARVQPDDDVWCLGDFCWRDVARYGARLSGRKHLVTGNHDGDGVRDWLGWASVQPYRELKLAGRRVVLFHYPIAEWNGFFRGAVHLYGHVHGSRPATSTSCDVGVDCWHYAPVSWQEIEGFLACQPAA